NAIQVQAGAAFMSSRRRTTAGMPTSPTAMAAPATVPSKRPRDGSGEVSVNRSTATKATPMSPNPTPDTIPARKNPVAPEIADTDPTTATAAAGPLGGGR